MTSYIKRMFSWNGLAGRREFLGWYVLPFGLFSLAIILPACITVWSDYPIGAGFKLWGLAVAIILLVMSLCAWARRLRHLGWPCWVALLLLIPGINPLVYLAGIVLVLCRSDRPHREDAPTFMALNLSLAITGILLPVCLVFGTVLMAKHYPQQFLHMLPQKQLEQTTRPIPVQTSHTIPADIIVPQEHSRPAARTKPMPMTLPAPKLTVLADKIPWKRPFQECDAVCQQVLPHNDRCVQYMSPDEQARLCVHLWHKPSMPLEYHQVLINPQRQISEYAVFNYDKKPLVLGHFREGKLKELFYRFSDNKTYFFHIAKDGFTPDFTDINHWPTEEYADISIALLSADSWAPVSFEQDGNSSEGNPRELTTPWSGFNLSNQFLSR